MIKKFFINYLTLFTSMSTLLCCALPSFLIFIGSGSVVISLFSNFPSLLWLAEQKVLLFSFSAIVLLISYYLNFIKYKKCPIDEKQECQKVKATSKVIFYISIILYAIGFFMSFIASKIFY